MDRFEFGNYDDSKQLEGPFTASKGYTGPSGEMPTRKQFSYPMQELKDYVNKMTNSYGDLETPIKLRINSQNLLQYKDEEDGEWKDTSANGHRVLDQYGVFAPQRPIIQFLDTDIEYDDDKIIVSGLQGPQGQTGPQGAQGPQGEPGADGRDGNNFIVRGRFNTETELKTVYPEGSSHPERMGWAYFVGPASQKNPVYNWNEETYYWDNCGYIQGPQGPQGPQGETGSQGPQGLPGIGVPSGGTTGQVLKKHSDSAYDTEWGAMPSVDQTYDGASTNAQSGKAVKGAIDGIPTATTSQKGLLSATDKAKIDGMITYDVIQVL